MKNQRRWLWAMIFQLKRKYFTKVLYEYAPTIKSSLLMVIPSCKHRTIQQKLG